MILKPESLNIEDYLKSTDIINSNDPSIQFLAMKLTESSLNEIEQIQAIYHYVRDQILHSFDINGSFVTYRASDVLKYKEGICFSKSHLLAALLRAANIPTGFCYQKLILDDDLYPYLVYHGLNAVFIKSLNSWIRLDARGNKEGVNAQFNLSKEQLAFPVRQELGEIDFDIIYINPLSVVLDSLANSKTVNELKSNLPR